MQAGLPTGGQICNTSHVGHKSALTGERGGDLTGRVDGMVAGDSSFRLRTGQETRAASGGTVFVAEKTGREPTVRPAGRLSHQGRAPGLTERLAVAVS